MNTDDIREEILLFLEQFVSVDRLKPPLQYF